MRGIFFTKSPRWAEASGDADCVPTPWSILAPMAGWNPALREGGSC